METTNHGISRGGGRSLPGSTASLEQSLADALAGGYAGMPLRRTFWSQRRADGTWLAGAVVVLILVATLPLSLLCMSILTMAAMATCLRAFALHQYTQRLSELAEQQQGGASDADSDGSGAASGAAGPLSSAQRRARRPSLLTAVAAAGRPFSLLHLRLSLVDRDFTEPGDYELLLRLDELENGAQQEAQQPPPLPESQLALLPVHIHRTPTKKAKKQQRGPFDSATPRASPEEANTAPARGSGSIGGQPVTAPAAAVAGGGQRALRPAGFTPRTPPGQPAFVPVLQEQPSYEWASLEAAARASSFAAAGHSGARSSPPGSAGSRWAAAGFGGDGGQEIVPATPPQSAHAPSPTESEGSEEDEEFLCSVCLEPFDDGAKILSLPCRHQYHEACVKTWLRYKGIEATCPNCKGQVFTPEGPEAQQ